MKTVLQSRALSQLDNQMQNASYILEPLSLQSAQKAFTFPAEGEFFSQLHPSSAFL